MLLSSRAKRLAQALGIALFAVAGAIVAPGQEAAAPSALPWITSVREMRRLTAEQTEQRYPVHLTAMVTFYCEAEYWSLFVQDDTGGTYVKLPATNALVPGDCIEITGITDPGDFAPMALATNIVKLGHKALPPPKRVSYDELASGVEDGAWVEAEGVVRLAEPGTLGRTYMEIIVDSQRISVLVSTLDLAAAQRLVNATVRIQGVCYTHPNSRRQIRAPWLAVTGASDITVVEPSISQPITVTLTNLLQYKSEGRYGRRVQVKGVVALQQPGRAIFIEDGNQGLCVKTQQGTPVEPGDVVEVTGFPVLGQHADI